MRFRDQFEQKIHTHKKKQNNALYYLRGYKRPTFCTVLLSYNHWISLHILVQVIHTKSRPKIKKEQMFIGQSTTDINSHQDVSLIFACCLCKSFTILILFPNNRFPRNCLSIHQKWCCAIPYKCSLFLAFKNGTRLN